MKDFFLKFDSIAEMTSSMLAVGFLENEEEPKYLYHGEMLLDIIGIIYSPQNESGENIEYVAVPGYHVNLRVINDALNLSALDKFIVNPETPVRVWAQE